MKLLDTNRYYLKGTSNKFLHIATIEYGIREFMCFFEVIENKLFIEECTGGNLQFIDDDDLATELSNFLFHKGTTDLKLGAFVADKF
jgi:hypothetical protein